jgi:hypothetical protein
VQYRFPSLAASVKPQVLTPDPDLDKSRVLKKTKGKTKSATASAGPSGRATPTTSSLDPAALNAAFGPGGKVYQKQHDSLDVFPPSRGGSGSGLHRSQPASGAQTPRRGGAITITEVKKPAPASKGKAKESEDKIWDLPKSKEVKGLEKIIADLRGVQAGEGKVVGGEEKPPCFCQGS